MDEIIYAVAADLAAIVGDALSDIDFDLLVDRIVSDKMTPAMDA